MKDKNTETGEYVIEFDMNGRVTRFNKNFTSFIGTARSEILGTYLSDFFPEMRKNVTEYMKFWTDLRVGKIRDEVIWLQCGKDLYSLSGSFVPVKSRDTLDKVICYAQPASETIVRT